MCDSPPIRLLVYNSQYNYFGVLDLLDSTALGKLSNIDKGLLCHGGQFFTNTTSLWNTLPNYIQNISNATKFKNELHRLRQIPFFLEHALKKNDCIVSQIYFFI